ncbi:MAG: hypothetical protein AB8E82_19220 [Aureispira sp.]
MLQPIIKKSEALSPAEIASLNKIIGGIHSQNPENHIEENHIQKTNPVFYLFKKEDEILAFQAFTIFKKKTPFHRKEIPIINVNISYKNPKADKLIKDYAKFSNFHFIKQQLGPFWFLKTFVVSFVTINPKLIHRISRIFGSHYPDYRISTPKEVHHFAKNFIAKDLKIAANHVNNNLVITEESYEDSPITEQWPFLYESKNPLQNEFFIKEGIIKQANNQYFLTNKAVLFLGVYSFWGLVKSVFRKK